MTPVIPAALGRRLILALLGCHYREGCWWRDDEPLSEEAVDAMTDAQWARYVRRWTTSATDHN